MSVHLPSSAHLPAAEIKHIAQLFRSHPDHLSTAHVRGVYASLGLEVLPDPFGPDLADRIVRALQSESPFSVIRLSDGEMNMIAFPDYPETPQLNDFAIRGIMGIQEDLIEVDELWKVLLRELLMSAILQADVVGVTGLWWGAAAVLDAERLVAGLKTNPRGFYGQWQGVDYLLRLARAGVLKDKIVTAVHLYFGVLKNLDRILSEAKRIVLLTNHVGVVEKMRRKYPRYQIDHVPVGTASGAMTHRPDFLQAVAKNFPRDMRGSCCLLGAGFWSEIYCTWIKQRGGVAIDIGSGFNLLDGGAPRPAHRGLGLDRHNPFAL